MHRLGRWLAGLTAVWLLVGSACAPQAPAASTQSGARAQTAAPQADTLQGLIDAARQEGQLNLVWAPGLLGDSENIRRLAEGFNKHYGLNLSVQYTPGPPMTELTPKLIQEYQVNRRASTDVFVGYDSTTIQLIQADALTSSDWTSWAPNIRNPQLIAPKGMAVTFQTAIPGITYNTSRLTGDAVPRSLAALLKPEYKGRIASTPYGSSFDRLATPEMWGEERAMEYVTKLSDQLAGLMRCNELERIASGEFDALVFNCSQSNTLSMKAKGMPVDFVIPSDAALVVYIYLAVPKTAPNPSSAKLWINYILSREAQDLLFDSEFTDSHLVEGSKTARDVEQLERTGVKFTVSNVEFMQTHDVTEMGRIVGDVQAILKKQR
jgi:ABC-type Fe3+ transport system substrate-binding protein